MPSLTATAVDRTTVQLSWPTIATYAACTTGYAIVINSTNSTTLTIANITVYNVSVEPDNLYVFEVAAVDLRGTIGPYSASALINVTGWFACA